MCPTKRERNQGFDSNVSRLKEAFNVLDRDGDGIIATSDLELFLLEVVSCKLISKEDVQRMLALVEGDVDFEQFLRLLNFRTETDDALFSSDQDNSVFKNTLCALEGKSDGLDEDNKAFKTMFEVLDRNEDGFVCAEDLKSVMRTLGQRLTDKDILGMLQGHGSIDNKVTYEQFVQLMTVSR